MELLSQGKSDEKANQAGARLEQDDVKGSTSALAEGTTEEGSEGRSRGRGRQGGERQDEGTMTRMAEGQRMSFCRISGRITELPRPSSALALRSDFFGRRFHTA